MGRSSSFYTTLARIERENIKRKNAQIIQSNYNLVDSWNNEIQSNISIIENYHKSVKLEKFDVDKYYDSKLIPLTFDKYKPIKKPSENKLRRKIGCMRENIILEKLFKDRKSKRLERGKQFEKEWQKIYSEYEINEENNLKEYNEYKKQKKKENDRLNKIVYDSRKKYDESNSEELGNVIQYYLENNKNIKKESIGSTYLSISVVDNQVWQIDICFETPEKIVPSVKKYTYLKTKNTTKETYFSEREKENIYEAIIFNSAFYYLATIGYTFSDKIESFIINCYVNGINSAKGIPEKKYIMSAMFDHSEVNYNNIDLIDSKAFFNSVNAKYSLPLIDLKKIIPYANNKIDSMDYINNEINGFDFEHLSKNLLENNGFEEVKVTQASGDYGADIIAVKDKIKYAIQCKKYSSKVGVKAVQEVMASREMYKCHVGAILTNNYFTPNAIKLAEENKILLWDYNDLSKMLEILNEKSPKINKVDFKRNSEEVIEEEIENKEETEEKFENDKEQKNDRKKKQALEEEMDTYGLEEWQKDLVRKGDYNPWNFEEEDSAEQLEEEDYYYEDEK